MSKEQCPKTFKDKQCKKIVPYASAVGSLIYTILCTIPDICYIVDMVSKYQSNPGPKHQTAVKHIFKYLRRTRDYILTYGGSDLIPVSYTNSDFMSDMDSRKSTSGYVFTFGRATVSWKSINQQCIANSTAETKYVATTDAIKETFWLKKFLLELGVVPQAQLPIILYYDNNEIVA